MITRGDITTSIGGGREWFGWSNVYFILGHDNGQGTRIAM